MATVLVVVRLSAAQAVPDSPVPQTAPQPIQQGVPLANLPAPQTAPQVWTWEQVKDRLELNNPTLLAGKLNISECRRMRLLLICGRIHS